MLDNRIYEAIKTYCYMFCIRNDRAYIHLAIEDAEIICNPNLQIDSFVKTKHVPGLTKHLVDSARYYRKHHNI